MTVRHRLNNRQWDALASYLPEPEASPKGGRPRRSNRQMLDAILWRARTGAPWRDLPAEFGPWKTVYHRWREWTDSGALDRAMQWIIADLEERGRLNHALWYQDGSSVRAQKSAAGAPQKKAPATPKIPAS